MRSIRLLTLALLATFALASCNKDDDTPEGGGEAVKFSTSISGDEQGKTRAAGTMWDTGDQIGVFMANTGAGIATALAANSNVQYTNSGSGFTSTTPIYYPAGSQAVDFVAYYPWWATPASEPTIYKVDVSSAKQSDPTAIDLLYSNNAVNKTRSATAVGLTFDHAMSRIIINAQAGTGVTAADLTGMTVKITGMPATADFALADGAFSNKSNVSDITPRTVTGGFEAIVVPQNAGEFTGRTAVFTLTSGESLTAPIPDADAFPGSKICDYTATISRTGVTLSTRQITDWTGTDSSEDIGEGIPQEITVKGIQMVYIPKGTFQMGSPTTDTDAYVDEKPQHWVKLTKDFYMGKYEITNTQYAAFLNAKDIGQNGRGSVTYSKDGGAPVTEAQTLISYNSWGIGWNTNDSKWIPAAGKDNFPVIRVTWYGAMAYCNWLSEQTGQTWTLPTEAQWEYTCRAGTTTRYSFGDDAANLGDYAWFNTNSGDVTHEVGTKQPNPWGLYDMHGNVFDWCLDQWDGSNNYPTTATENDAIADPYVTVGAARVLRSSSWDFQALGCRSALRRRDLPIYANYNVGFRVVFVP